MSEVQQEAAAERAASLAREAELRKETLVVKEQVRDGCLRLLCSSWKARMGSPTTLQCLPLKKFQKYACSPLSAFAAEGPAALPGAPYEPHRAAVLSARLEEISSAQETRASAARRPRLPDGRVTTFGNPNRVQVVQPLH